mmetsp:Transcript_23312/g.31957  ORF Transcript_23312/g.31957 Transcript_23312/m.31957 type:complete len:538 (+) Transcript_23312:1-1614(+)
MDFNSLFTFERILTVALICISIGIILSKLLKKRSSLSGPTNYPIIGNAIDFSPDNLVAAVKRYTQKYGNFFVMHMFSKRVIVISDLDCILDILLRRPKYFRRSDILDPIAKMLEQENSSFFAYGAHWSRLRRSTTPPFNRKNVIDMSSSIWEEIKNTIHGLLNKADGNGNICVDGKEELIRFTASVLTVVAFGGEQPENVRKYCISPLFFSDLRSIMRLAGQRAVTPIPDWLWNISPFYFHFEKPGKAASNRLRSASNDIIAGYKAKIAFGNDTISNKPKRAMKSLIETLVRMNEEADTQNTTGNRLSEEEIVSNIEGFFVAGTDTTAASLSFALFYLSTHLKYTERAREEADRFFIKLKEFEQANIGNDNDATISQFIFDSVQHDLPLCRAAMKETLRLVSPASVLFMQSALSTPLILNHSNDVEVFPSDMLMINVDACLRDPSVFIDPLSFLPDRWIENPTELMEKSFVAFGGGPRQCPGMGLVMDLEAPLVIASMLHHFEIQVNCPVEEVQRVFQFIMDISKLPLILRRRNSAI